MAQYTIPYGKRQIHFEVEDRNVLYFAAPVAINEKPSPDEAAEEALDNPYGSPRLEELVKPGQSIAILVDDITRPTPRRLLLDHLLTRLAKAGVSDSQVSLIAALGTHRQVNDVEIEALFGRDLLDRFRFINIDYKDETCFVDLGESENGTPIHVYREVVESDFKIALGNVVPHINAGWGGGGKMIQPGVCSERTTEVTHLLACTRQNVLEVCGVADNLCRREIETIAGQVGLDFIINTVLDEQRNVLGVFCGHYIEAHRAAVSLADRVLRPAIPQKADIVVASANPADIDFWQGCKPYIFAHYGVREGGIIILAIQAEEGLCGNAPQHEKTIRDYSAKSFSEVNTAIDNGEIADIVGASVPLYLSILRDRVSTICVSEGINALDAEALGFAWADSIESALAMAYTQLGMDAKVGIIPYCGETLVREAIVSST